MKYKSREEIEEIYKRIEQKKILAKKRREKYNIKKKRISKGIKTFGERTVKKPKIPGKRFFVPGKKRMIIKLGK